MPLPGANCVFHSPVGYIYDPDGRTIMDPNEEIQHAVATLFKAFRTTGSAYGVVRYFAENSLFFPKRAYGGAWDGKITWGTLTPQPRPLQSSTTLPMPGHTFMGVTAITKPLIPHGAFRTPSLSVSQIRMTGKSFSPTIIRLISPGKSSRKTRIALAPTVQTRNGGGPAREGAALPYRHPDLREMRPPYDGSAIQGLAAIRPLYECVGRWEHGNKATCSSVPAEPLDHAVSEKNPLHHEAFGT